MMILKLLKPQGMSAESLGWLAGELEKSFLEVAA